MKSSLLSVYHTVLNFVCYHNAAKKKRKEKMATCNEIFISVLTLKVSKRIKQFSEENLKFKPALLWETDFVLHNALCGGFSGNLSNLPIWIKIIIFF